MSHGMHHNNAPTVGIYRVMCVRKNEMSDVMVTEEA